MKGHYECPRLTASVLAAGMLFAAALGAQEAEDADDEDQPASIDEIVVTGERDGDPRVIDPRSEAVLREQVFAEFRQIRREREQEAFRLSLPERTDEPGRVKWGYDARAELRMRRETSLIDVDQDGVRPATLFRVEF